MADPPLPHPAPDADTDPGTDLGTDPGTTAEAPPKIRVRGLTKRFGGNHVLRGVDLDLAAGESLVVIGGSGSGKSVLIKCIIGLLAPDSGTIEIDGVDVTRMSARARRRLMLRFGMLFQGAALFDSLPVWHNVAFALIQAHRIGRHEARRTAIETLASVGLDESVADLFPAELSGGMQKRVGLARAITARPEILFFDEPTTGLDPIMSDVINKLIVACTRKVGATGLSITHDMGSVRHIADRVAMLHGGHLVWQGPVGAIDESGNPYVDQFVHGHAEGPIELRA